ncbi:hypothetical protein B5F35_00400 [Anaeromassilibacillus sp. An200]|nr:hypothetical protein B5F35_00400 [Anaeromassilibacillus sp. An200]
MWPERVPRSDKAVSPKKWTHKRFFLVKPAFERFSQTLFLTFLFQIQNFFQKRLDFPASACYDNEAVSTGSNSGY